MHRLKEEMIMNLDLKGFSPLTKKTYLQHMKNYTRYFQKSPELLGEAEIKEYLHYLITERKVGDSYVSSAYSALKFFYVNTLHREWDFNRIPRTKKSHKLPLVLSKDEVRRIFEVTINLKHRAILMTTYSAGLRVSETANLKITDVDSQRMQLRIEQGKGKKDRYTLLSDYNLKILREYWNIYHPNIWLFPGAQPLEPSFHNNDQVFNYLGRYTHRVAISNNRIQKVENEKVTFHWRDYQDENKKKLMTIEAIEFIRRFLLHILPPQFVKIRHYGILSNRSHREKMKLCRKYLGVADEQQHLTTKNISWQDLFQRITGVDLRVCPVCGTGQMRTQETLNPMGKDPFERLILVSRFLNFLTYRGNLAIGSP
ncbi:MAG: transposase [Firmicutes bacterium]|nr:transposase [Bacillota bacterium]